MSSGRQTLWNALVWALIPFTLGAGLPQMQCRCAAAKGQRWSECCFQNRDELKPAETTNDRPCCQRRSAKLKEGSSPSMKAVSGCQTCQSLLNSKSGSCCDLKRSEAPTLNKPFELPGVVVSFVGLPPVEWRLASIFRREEVWSGHLERSTFDRVVVFAHLLI